MRVAICFFGITRSLKHTLPSIRANVLTPARAMGAITIQSHFFLQREINNPRANEHGSLDVEEYRLLENDKVELEEPDLCLGQWDFEGLKVHGDFWDNSFVSLRNLIHQLHSLQRVTRMMLTDNPVDEDLLVVFCRPDLRYHDSLSEALAAAAASTTDRVFIPRWQAWGGCNDRFAICRGRAAALAYGFRIDEAEAYCRETGGPLHSERLLGYALRKAAIPISTIKARASRVRIDGSERWEDFSNPTVSNIRRRLHAWKRALVS